ncbi:MAG: alpha-amylase, partial [Planctomycetes bacterium]|nr:alpha-amylase [Planctomycetota bacterium]
HDEPRTAAVFEPDKHRAAAALTFLSPGLRFFHQGQFEGAKVRISPHLVRGPDEPVCTYVAEFYDRLLAVLRKPVVREGAWSLLESRSAWDGNGSHEAVIAFFWRRGDEQLLVAVNFADHASQARVRLPLEAQGARVVALKDGLSPAVYDRMVDELTGPGLYLDMAPWQAQAFDIGPVVAGTETSGSR